VKPQCLRNVTGPGDPPVRMESFDGKKDYSKY
jgi:hypothetical protein